MVFAYLGFMVKEFGNKLSNESVAMIIGGLVTSIGTIIAFYYKDKN